MKKRIIALLLAACMLLSLTAGCTGKKDSDASAESPSPVDNTKIDAVPLSADMTCMTRAEWIILLGSAMGMDAYADQTPHFSDVGPDTEYFAYVQSTFEWGVLDFESDPFRPDEMATKEFVAVTAVLASRVKSSQDSTVSDLSVFAESNGVVSLSQGDWDSGVMLAEGRLAAEVAKQLYLAHRDQEVNEVTLAEGVKDFRNAADGSVWVEGSTLVMPAAMAAGLAVGDIYMAPGTLYDPYGIAMKITSVETAGDLAYLSTEEPDLGEVFTDINVSAQVAPTPEQIILTDGVQLNGYVPLSSGQWDSNMVPLSNSNNQPSGASFSFQVEKSSGKATRISVSPEWESHKVTIENLIPTLPLPENFTGNGLEGIEVVDDDSVNTLFEKTNYITLKDNNGNVRVTKDGWEQYLEVERKFTAGYELSGTVELENFYVQPTLEFHKLWGIPTGIDRVAVEVNYDLSSSLSLKGTLDGEITIATMPIPIAGSPLTIELSLIAFMDASGEIALKWEMGNNVKFEYTHGKTMATQSGHQSQSMDLSVELESGLAFDVMLKAAGIKVIDAKLSGAVNAEGKAYVKSHVTTEGTLQGGTPSGKLVYEYLVGMETIVRLPIVKLKIGNKNTLANKLRLTYEWTLISKEDAPVQWKPASANPAPKTICRITVDIDSNGLDPDITPSPEPVEPDRTFRTPLKIEKMVMTLNIQEREQILINSLPDDITINEVSFTSENPAVATVNANGDVTANSPGTARILIQTSNGDLQICLVNVIEDYSIQNGSFL